MAHTYVCRCASCGTNSKPIPVSQISFICMICGQRNTASSFDLFNRSTYVYIEKGEK